MADQEQKREDLKPQVPSKVPFGNSGAPGERPDQAAGEVQPTEEWGERIDTGKTIGSGGGHPDKIPGSGEEK